MRFIVLVMVVCGWLAAADFTDMLGRHVVFEKTPKTFVAIGPGALRLMVYLGLNDAVMGIEEVEKQSIDRVPYRASLGADKIASLPIIGKGGHSLPNVNALKRIKPDAIVAAGFSADTLNALQVETGVSVIAVQCDGSSEESVFESIKQSMALLGEVFHKKISANATAIFMDRQRRWLETDIKNKPTAYIGGILHGGQRGFFSTRGDYLPFEMLDMNNSVFRKNGYGAIGQEDVLKVNPEYIFLDVSSRKSLRKEMKAERAFFEKLDAFKNKKTLDVLPYYHYGVNVENCFVNAYLIKSFILGQPINQKKIKSNYNSFFPVNSDKAYQAAHKLLFN